MTNQLGKRSVCAVCGTEVLCTKSGDGVVMCCGKQMDLKQTRALPSAD